MKRKVEVFRPLVLAVVVAVGRDVDGAREHFG